MANSNMVREVHMCRILTIATQLFLSQTMGRRNAADPKLPMYYPNIMTAIPNAFVQWEIEHREYCAQWQDPEYEIRATVEEIRTMMQLAFQFPANYIR